MIGIVVITADYVLRVIYYENMPMELNDVLLLVSATMPIYFFRGRLATLLGIGISVHAATTVFYDLCFGVALAAAQGDIEHLDTRLIAAIVHAICTGIIAVLICLLYTSRCV